MSSFEARRGLLARRRAGRQQHLVSGDRWLVSYADFMTLLFAFFVVLFATSRHSGDALGKLSGSMHAGFSGKPLPAPTPPSPTDEAVPAATPQPDLTELAGELRSVLGQSIAQHSVSVQMTRDGLVISFEELGFFQTGEANLLGGQAATIVQAGRILQQHDATLRVEGHSDDQPIHNAVFSSNWELSAARAMTVLLLMVDQAAYDPTRISMAGYGPYRPVASNSTAEGRQKNRRVDLVVVHSSPMEKAAGPVE